MNGELLVLSIVMIVLFVVVWEMFAIHQLLERPTCKMSPSGLPTFKLNLLLSYGNLNVGSQEGRPSLSTMRVVQLRHYYYIYFC